MLKVCCSCLYKLLTLSSLLAVLDLRAHLDVRMFCVDRTVTSPDVVTLPQVLASQPTEPVTEKCTGYNDPIFYIYTSGTTGISALLCPYMSCLLSGLPKAAIIKHSRYLFASYCLYCMGLTYHDDILYSVLPMYHSAAHVCIGVTITEGNTAVTRKKFSATKFWEDCVKNDVTVSFTLLINAVIEFCVTSVPSTSGRLPDTSTPRPSQSSKISTRSG